MVKRVVISGETIKRAGVRSTKASAMLSGREVPDGHERSTAVQRSIDEQATEIPSGEWIASAIDVNEKATAAPVAAGLCWDRSRAIVTFPTGDFRANSEYHGDVSKAALCATRRSSDLSKHSAEVFAEAEDHPVTVTRRDGEALVLMSQREADSRTRMLNLAAQLIGVMLDGNGALADRMCRAFPWMLALSPEDRTACAHDLVDAARASFTTEQPYLVLAELASWKETATAIAGGLCQGKPDWLDGDAVVARP